MERNKIVIIASLLTAFLLLLGLIYFILISR
jgi:hypothetical protein